MRLRAYKKIQDPLDAADGLVMITSYRAMSGADDTMEFDAEPKTLTDIWADIPTQDLVYGLPPLVTEVPGWGDLRGEE
jgi:hypothetical protein